MLAVAIDWKIYELTGSAFDLGLVGLIQFVPAVIFTLLIGHFADRYDRRHIVRFAPATYALAALTIFAGLLNGAISRDWLFVAVFLTGCARLRIADRPRDGANHRAPPLIPRVVAAWTSVNQTAVICSPAAGGLIYAFNPVLLSAICFAFFLVAIVLVTLMKVERVPSPLEPVTLTSVLAALIGAVPSAFIGGLGSLLVAAIWMMIFPSLRRIDRFEPARQA
jgi:MFS family permease